MNSLIGNGDVSSVNCSGWFILSAKIACFADLNVAAVNIPALEINVAGRRSGTARVARVDKSQEEMGGPRQMGEGIFGGVDGDESRWEAG